MGSIKRMPLLPLPARVADQTFWGGVAHSKARFSIKSGESHPAADDLEEYYFGRLTWHQGNALEYHLARCASCSKDLQDLEGIVGVLSSAIQGDINFAAIPDSARSRHSRKVVSLHTNQGSEGRLTQRSGRIEIKDIDARVAALEQATDGSTVRQPPGTQPDGRNTQQRHNGNRLDHGSC